MKIRWNVHISAKFRIHCVPFTVAIRRNVTQKNGYGLRGTTRISSYARNDCRYVMHAVLCAQTIHCHVYPQNGMKGMLLCARNIDTFAMSTVSCVSIKCAILG